MNPLLVAVLLFPLILAAAVGLSSLVAPPSRLLGGGKRAVDVILRIALGFGLISYATLAAAALRFLSPLFFYGLVLAGTALFLVRFPVGEIFKILRPRRPRSLFAWLVLIFVLVNLFFCLFPPTFYDSMLYHLAVPQYYLAAGGLPPWPTNFNSNLPLNGEMLFMFTLLGGTAHMAKFISLIAGLSIVILLGAWYREKYPGGNSVLAPLVFYTIPQIGFLSASSKPDLLGLLFVLCAVYLYFQYLENRRRSDLLLCGVFWGFALGTKYIFAFFLAGFFLAHLLFFRAKAGKKLLVPVVISLLVILCLSPWFVKNTVICGNPVYPYLNSVFPSPGWSQEQGMSFSNGLRRGQGFDPVRYLAFPLELFTKPYRYGATAAWGVLVLLLLPALVFTPREGPARFLIVCAVFTFLALSLFARVPRYFLGCLMFLSLPLAASAETASSKFRKLRPAGAVMVVLLSLFQLVQQVDLQETFSQAIHFTLHRIRSGKETDLKYLDALPYHRAAEFINTRLGADTRVLLVGEDRTFYIRRPFLAVSFADRHPFLQELKSGARTERLHAWLKSERITHILYSREGLRRLGEMSPTHRISDGELGRLERFLSALRLDYRDRRYVILSVE